MQTQNGHIKSFHKLLKKEYEGSREFERREDAQEAARVTFEDYN